MKAFVLVVIAMGKNLGSYRYEFIIMIEYERKQNR